MNVLVIAAHSDDEVLGCGGTILKHTSNGDRVKIIFLTNGVGARNGNEKEIEARRDATKKVMDKLKVEDFELFDFPDNKLDSVPLLDIVQTIETSSKAFQPEIVYTHFSGDLNVDHHITNKAVLTAFRPLPSSSVKKILAFEVLSSTEWGVNSFSPNYFVNVTKFKNEKMEVLKMYDEEMRDSPHTRSYKNVESLMTYRGHSVGYEYSEAFSIERILEP